MIFILLSSFLFFQLLLPHIVNLLRVEIWEDNVEDVAVPVDCMAFDVRFNILRFVSKILSHAE